MKPFWRSYTLPISEIHMFGNFRFFLFFSSFFLASRFIWRVFCWVWICLSWFSSIRNRSDTLPEANWVSLKMTSLVLFFYFHPKFYSQSSFYLRSKIIHCIINKIMWWVIIRLTWLKCTNVVPAASLYVGWCLILYF